MLRFYVSGAFGLAAGALVEGKGALSFDSYLWTEFLSSYPDPPDLFYQMRIARIQTFNEEEEVQDMAGWHKTDEAYLLDLSPDDSTPNFRTTLVRPCTGVLS